MTSHALCNRVGLFYASSPITSRTLLPPLPLQCAFFALWPTFSNLFFPNHGENLFVHVKKKSFRSLMITCVIHMYVMIPTSISQYSQTPNFFTTKHHALDGTRTHVPSLRGAHHCWLIRSCIAKLRLKCCFRILYHPVGVMWFRGLGRKERCFWFSVTFSREKRRKNSVDNCLLFASS